MMPIMDGLEVLKQIRKEGIFTPTLFLTARGDLDDRVAGLEAGADDYLPKPFAGKELTARVKALTRRRDAYVPSVLSFRNISLDRDQYILASPTDTFRLNNKEFQIMELFMRNPNHIFSTEHLMERIWGMESETEIDVVWTNIGFLRKKLKSLCANIQIKTIRGAGYLLELFCYNETTGFQSAADAQRAFFRVRSGASPKGKTGCAADGFSKCAFQRIQIYDALFFGIFG